MPVRVRPPARRLPPDRDRGRGATVALAAASPTRRALGAMLVSVPLPLALTLHLLARPATPLDQAAFLVGVVAFGIGVFLVLPPREGVLQ